MTPAVMAPIALPEMLNVGPERLRDEMDSINTSTTHYGLPRRRAKSVAGTARGSAVVVAPSLTSAGSATFGIEARATEPPAARVLRRDHELDVLCNTRDAGKARPL